jgi:hypothetical protein
MDDYRLLNEVDIANAFHRAKLARDQATSKHVARRLKLVN